jgi:hypothetical protein
MNEQAPEVNQLPEQIQHPDSIPHNFDQSEPIAVVERGYNTSSEHPHPVNYFEEVGEEGEEEKGLWDNVGTQTKQRGIIYEDTTLGGKPFTVAYRPGSKKAPEAPEAPEAPTQPYNIIEEHRLNRYKPLTEAGAKREEELRDLQEDFRKTRDNYAKISAGRSRRAILFGRRYSKNALAKAEEEFDIAQIALTTKEVEIAIKDLKVSREDLGKVESASAAENQWGLATTLLEARTNTPKGKLGNLTRKFHEWWNKQNKATKSVSMLGAGAVIGLPAGILAGPVLGVIAGGALGASVAKSVARNRMSLRADLPHDISRAEEMDDWYQHRLIHAPAEHGRIYEDVILDTEEHVNLNRWDTAIAIGSAALGGVGGGIAGHALLGKSAGHTAAKGAVHHGGHASHTAHNQGTHGQHGNNGGHNNHPPKKTGPTVNPNNINHEYVSQVYEHAEGLHPGFTDMTHAANLAQHHGLIKTVYPHPGNPSDFYYVPTKAGAKLIHMKEGSPVTTTDVVKILSHFSKLKLS